MFRGGRKMRGRGRIRWWLPEVKHVNKPHAMLLQLTVAKSFLPITSSMPPDSSTGAVMSGVYSHRCCVYSHRSCVSYTGTGWTAEQSRAAKRNG